LRSVAAPILAETAERVGETIQLAVLERDKVLYVDKVVATKTITVNGARIGWRLDAHCSAVGKVLLAFADEAVSERVCGGPLRRLTAATVVNPAELRRELEVIRVAGVAFDRGEILPDIHCVAAPVRDERGVVIAAMSLTAPANRFAARREELKAAVVAACAGASRALKAGPAAGPAPNGALRPVC
jgi:DNA-binding IclR family transcriptional regulator